MDIDIRRRTIGINFSGEEASVLLWAPLAEKVSVVVDDTALLLTKKEYGYWHLATNKLKEGAAYRFSLDGKEPLPDPASLSQPEGVHGPSVALDLSRFTWTDRSWKNIPLEKYILYELHTGTFTAAGSFEAVEEKLDHLLELGVNAIEVMPVAQFPGSRNWGYDGVYPFAVQHSYGGPRALHQLVDRCHRKGIAVVLDVVYNHMGPEGNYFAAYAPYFTEKYNTPWGGAINFDDQWCDGVRRYFIENVLMWFRDFHIDALRLDAVHAIRDLSPNHILREIRQHTDQLMKATGRTHYLIVESDLNDTRFINPLQQQGYGMDAQWTDEFHHALRVSSGQPPSGYYSDFNGLQHLAKAYTDAYVYDGQFSPHRKRKFGVKAAENPGQQFVVFSQNHDQVGNRMLGERTSSLVGFEMQKLLAAAVMVSPFIPMLFMGEEWSEPHPFLYFVSHTDPDLAEAVRKGRREEFASFHAQGEAPDPMAEKTFERSKLQWQLLDKEHHRLMFHYYKKLIGLRKSHPLMQSLNRKALDATADPARQLLFLHRWNHEKHLYCLMNFSKNEQEVALPSNRKWNCLLASSEKEWGGPLTQPRSIGTSVLVAPESIIICNNEQAATGA